MIKTYFEAVEAANKVVLNFLTGNATSEEVEEAKNMQEAARPLMYYTFWEYNKEGSKAAGYSKYKEVTKLETKYLEPTRAEELLAEYGGSIITGRSEEGETTHTAYYIVNGVRWLLTISKGNTMQDILTQWSKNMKESLEVIMECKNVKTYETKYDDETGYVTYNAL